MSGCRVLQAERSGVYVLKLLGEVRLNSCSTIDASIDAIVSDPSFNSLVVDLSESSLIDSTTLGLLAKLAIRAKSKSHFLPSIVSTNPDITRVLFTMGFDSIYLIVDKPLSSVEGLQELVATELCCEELDEQGMREQVLCAHKVLMDMNAQNYDQFKDLVSALELDVGIAGGSCSSRMG